MVFGVKNISKIDIGATVEKIPQDQPASLKMNSVDCSGRFRTCPAHFQPSEWPALPGRQGQISGRHIADMRSADDFDQPELRTRQVFGFDVQ